MIWRPAFLRTLKLWFKRYRIVYGNDRTYKVPHARRSLGGKGNRTGKLLTAIGIMRHCHLLSPRPAKKISHIFQILEIHTRAKNLNLSKNSHFPNLIFHKIHISKTSCLTKIHIFKNQIPGNYWIKSWFLPQCDVG